MFWDSRVLNKKLLNYKVVACVRGATTVTERTKESSFLEGRQPPSKLIFLRVDNLQGNTLEHQGNCCFLGRSSPPRKL